MNICGTTRRCPTSPMGEVGHSLLFTGDQITITGVPTLTRL